MSSASSTHLGETVEDEQELLLGQHQNLATDPSISKFANNSSQNTQPITNTSPASEATTDVSTSDTTEWEDDSDTETEYGHGELTVSDTYKHLDIMRSILLPERTNLVNRIMQEFWIIFYQDWATKFRKCGTNTSSTPSTTRECRIADQSAPSSGPQKHQREDDDPLPPDDRQGRDQKRPRYGSVVSGLIDDSMRLACPYRKHDPRRYSVQLWQSCALTSHDTVARVKYENKSRHVLKRLTSEGLIYTNITGFTNALGAKTVSIPEKIWTVTLWPRMHVSLKTLDPSKVSPTRLKNICKAERSRILDSLMQKDGKKYTMFSFQVFQMKQSLVHVSNTTSPPTILPCLYFIITNTFWC